MAHKPTVLCILDGWGHREEKDHNSIAQAKTPHWDSFLKSYPYSLLDASAQNVGLPQGQMGNSEVGHMTIGSGQILMQDLPRIDQSIEDESFREIPALKEFIQKLKASKGVCHLLGLLSPGGVHSHQKHLLAFANCLGDEGIPVYIHAFLDGRDTPPMSAVGYIEDFQKKLHPHAKIVTLGGRYYGMDRDKRWDRIEKAYQAIVKGEGQKVGDFLLYLKECYKTNIGDEFVPCAVDISYEGVRKEDGLFMANFRADRARQILQTLLLPSFLEFNTQQIKWEATLGMVEYAENLTPYLPVLFPPLEVKNCLGEVIAKNHLKQMRIAETEKYAHVTFFFNGGKEDPFEGEERILIPSPKVATYDLQPEMSAREVTNVVTKAIESGRFDFIVVNYANPDMVGHTGDITAAIQAVEVIDECLGKIAETIQAKQGVLIITADHGNVEEMENCDSGEPLTSHTLNPVPFVLIGADKVSLKNVGTLADIAPTILDLWGMEKPQEMTGTSLLRG
jgi:2,3-bisphosphoglycerate-independent phosphoglycerate mutase